MEGQLKRGVLVQVRNHKRRIRPRLQLQHYAHVVGGFVAHVHQHGKLLGQNDLGNTLHQARLGYVVRDGGDDDLLTAPLGLLDLPLAAHAHGALAGFVDLTQLFPGIDDLAAGRKIGTLDVPEQIFALQLAIVDQGHGGLAHLAQVVGRDVGGHAYRDAGAAVGEQVRNARGQHQGLLRGAVEVGPEIHRALLDLVEQLSRQRRQACLGVAVGGRCIAVERSEIAVPVHQPVTQREVLSHAHHGVVAGAIAVRMVLAYDRAHDGRALAKARVGVEVQVGVHGEEDPPLHGLEPVAYIRQGARRDDADRVVEIAALRLFGQIGVSRRRWFVAATLAPAAATPALALGRRQDRPCTVFVEKIELSRGHEATGDAAQNDAMWAPS